MTGWELTQDVIERMIVRLHELRPTLILECGSGQSTLHLARWAQGHAATLVTLEHLEIYAEATKRLVEGLPVDLRCASLVQGFYDTEVPNGVEFALIDGPPGAGVGRMKTFPRLWPHLASGFEVWLDDANRPHEQACLSAWKSEFPIAVREDHGGKGLAVIRRAA